ncbi:MAG: hypothetical protein OET18_02590 [Desulfobacterales bacterium]|jgi:hypothetical protein|nr:hypothetical protein [Desulfobacterales bacterium]
MSIIYSYPEQGALNANDMLIGTSAEKVGGKQKNITRNFTIQQIADFINRGAGFVDPVASDFQIPVFNQQGKKITGSIMSQNIYPNGSAITVSGSLTVTKGATIGDFTNDIIFQSPTVLIGPIKDANSALSAGNQILLSTPSGNVVWQNYEAGLTYEGTWNASTNTPTLTSGQGVSGHFYIVSAAGNTNLDGNNDWHVGDWAVFFDAGGAGTAAWQKIDNTSVLTGNGTANTFAMWTATETLNDSILTQDAGATKIQVAGGIDTTGIIQSSTTNANLQIQGNGTGGVEIMSADGVTDGKIRLNCSQNSHGVTLQSPSHGSTATYTLVLPTSTGSAGQILTTAGGSSSQLTWTTPLGNVIQAVSGPLTSGTIPIANGAYSVTDSIMSYSGTVISVNGDFSTQGLEVNKYLTDGTGSNGTDGQVLTSTTSGGDKEILWVDSSTIGDTYDLGSGSSGASNSIELQLTSGSGTDNSAITLTGGTGITVAQAGDVVTLTGSAQGVTSVATGDANTITIGGTATAPTVAANTAAVAIGSNNLATGDQIQTAINTAVSGSLNFKGTFNANTGAITSGSNFGSQLYTGTTGGVAITIGDYYIADTAGNFFGSTALQVGDEAIALATVGAGNSTISSFSVVPSAAAGVTSVLPSSTGLVSSGQPLVITPAGGTGTVTIESTAYAGLGNIGHVPSGGAAGKYLDGANGSWVNLPAGYTSWTASSDQNTNITVTDATNLPFTGRLASDGAYSSLTGESGIYTDTAINTGEVTIGLINNGGTPSATTFYRGDGQWVQAGGGTISKQLFQVTAATPTFVLNNPQVNPQDANYVNIFIDGVYQNSGTYTVATATGVTTVTLSTNAPVGTSVEIISTT